MTNVFIVVAPLQIECIPIESKSLGVLRVVRGELYQSGFKRRAIFLRSPRCCVAFKSHRRQRLLTNG
jgi:hypothetical protein